MDKVLGKLTSNYLKALMAIENELRRRYPIDTKVKVLLRGSQITPSIMTVIGYNPVYPTVRCRGMGKRGYFTRDAPLRRIIGKAG